MHIPLAEWEKSLKTMNTEVVSLMKQKQFIDFMSEKISVYPKKRDVMIYLLLDAQGK